MNQSGQHASGLRTLGMLLAILLLSAGGCSLLGNGDQAGSAAEDWSDDLGHGMRSTAASRASVSADRKQPFWEKWRDKRVEKINRNLNVEEPAGW